MKSSLKFCLIAFAILSMFSCDLAKFPIDDKAQMNIDPALLGKWKIEKVGKKSDLYTITKQDSMHYFITVKENKGKKIDTAYAFLSDVRKAKFLNVRCKGDSTWGYAFVRIIDISANGTKITAANVSDTMLRSMVSAAQIREHIYNNMTDPEFYSDTVHLVKVK